MPKEDRRIIFSYDETYKAIYALCVQKEMRKPPPGNIVSITLDDDDRNLTFNIHNMQDNSESDVDYSRDFVAAALLLFCRSHSIPVSKRANKTVEFKSEGVILRLVI